MHPGHRMLPARPTRGLRFSSAFLFRSLSFAECLSSEECRRITHRLRLGYDRSSEGEYPVIARIVITSIVIAAPAARRTTVRGETFGSSATLRKALLPWTSPSGSDRKSTRLNSSHVKISYAVFCLKKKK